MVYLVHKSKVHDSVHTFPFWFSETVPLCCLELAVILSQPLQWWDSKSGPGPALLILSRKREEALFPLSLPPFFQPLLPSPGREAVD